MKFLLYLALITIKTFATQNGGNYADYICPPNEGYIYCSDQGGICKIPRNVREGFMSYGADGRYNLIPFTNSKLDGGDISIKCDNDNGDIIPSNKNKKCCYKPKRTGFPDSNWAGYLHENYGWQHFNDFESQRYGADNRYIYRVMSKSVGWCNSEFFNDPYPINSDGKHCNYNHGEPSSLKTAEWTLCANENVECDGLTSGIKSAYHWIAYGVDGAFYYRLVKSLYDGRVPCNNDFFDDPVPGTNKYCWRSNGFSISEIHQGAEINNNNDYNYLAPQIIKYKIWYNLLSYIKYNLLTLCFMVLVIVISIGSILYLAFTECAKRRKKYEFVKEIDYESDV